jgi:hypothetical protein
MNGLRTCRGAGAFRPTIPGMNRIAALLLLLIASALPAANVRLAPRRNACGISFRAPRGWIVETYHDSDEIPCAIGMKPKGWNEDPEDRVGDYAVTLDVTRDDFDQAADRAGLVQVKTFRSELDGENETWPSSRFGDDDWVTNDWFGHIIRAAPIHSASWTGLMADVFTKRIGIIVIASVVSRTKSRTSAIVRGVRNDDAVRAVIRTIQFRRRP